MKCGVLGAIKSRNAGYGMRSRSVGTARIDQATGTVLAYVLAPHTDAALESLMQLLAPFGISRFYTDGWGGYTRLLDENQHEVGKQYTQRIERKH